MDSVHNFETENWDNTYNYASQSTLYGSSQEVLMIPVMPSKLLSKLREYSRRFTPFLITRILKSDPRTIPSTVDVNPMELASLLEVRTLIYRSPGSLLRWFWAHFNRNLATYRFWNIRRVPMMWRRFYGGGSRLFWGDRLVSSWSDGQAPCATGREYLLC